MEKFVKSCRNCVFPEIEGICYNVSGANNGYATEISDNFLCENWVISEFIAYQNFAKTTAIYKGSGKNIFYPAMGLAGESGEICNHVKKIMRGDATLEDMKGTLIKELGDVLWYVAAMATELDIDLNKIVRLNVIKLKDRKKRGVVKGSGDDR